MQNKWHQPYGAQIVNHWWQEDSWSSCNCYKIFFLFHMKSLWAIELCKESFAPFKSGESKNFM